MMGTMMEPLQVGLLHNSHPVHPVPARVMLSWLSGITFAVMAARVLVCLLMSSAVSKHHLHGHPRILLGLTKQLHCCRC